MLHVEGGVVVESPGIRLRLEGSGSALTLYVEGPPSLAVLRRVREAAPFARTWVPLLIRLGITVDVVVGKLRVARAGAAVESNALGRALGLDHVWIGA